MKCNKIYGFQAEQVNDYSPLQKKLYLKYMFRISQADVRQYVFFGLGILAALLGNVISIFLMGADNGLITALSLVLFLSCLCIAAYNNRIVAQMKKRVHSGINFEVIEGVYRDGRKEGKKYSLIIGCDGEEERIELNRWEYLYFMSKKAKEFDPVYLIRFPNGEYDIMRKED